MRGWGRQFAEVQTAGDAACVVFTGNGSFYPGSFYPVCVKCLLCLDLKDAELRVGTVPIRRDGIEYQPKVTLVSGFERRH